MTEKRSVVGAVYEVSVRRSPTREPVSVLGAGTKSDMARETASDSRYTLRRYRARLTPKFLAYWAVCKEVIY